MVWFYPSVAFALSKYSKYFQSHYGLILSRYYIPRPLHEEIPFNPTMVWFYRSETCWYSESKRSLSIPLWSDFIMNMADRIIKETLFQSHYGLILSEVVKTPLGLMYKFFQSHYGLILSIHTFRYQAVLPVSFNPTMVWFYPSLSLKDTVYSSDFQSHYGLILSLRSRWFVSTVTLSIPLWSDFIDWPDLWTDKR